MDTKINLSLGGYLNNPDPIKNSVPNLSVVRSGFQAMYAKNRADFAKDYKCMVFSMNNDKSHIRCIVKIPSDKYPIKYDVIIDLYQSSTQISRCDAKVYSNMPSFTYKSNYVFNMYGWLIREYIGKADAKATLDEPKITNPNLLIGYDKSLFYAFSYLTNTYVTYAKLREIASPKSEIRKIKIRSNEEILAEYKRAKTKYNSDNAPSKPKQATEKIKPKDSAKASTGRANNRASGRMTNKSTGRVNNRVGPKTKK